MALDTAARFARIANVAFLALSFALVIPFTATAIEYDSSDEPWVFQLATLAPAGSSAVLSTLILARKEPLTTWHTSSVVLVFIADVILSAATLTLVGFSYWFLTWYDLSNQLLILGSNALIMLVFSGVSNIFLACASLFIMVGRSVPCTKCGHCVQRSIAAAINNAIDEEFAAHPYRHPGQRIQLGDNNSPEAELSAEGLEEAITKQYGLKLRKIVAIASLVFAVMTVIPPYPGFLRCLAPFVSSIVLYLGTWYQCMQSKPKESRWLRVTVGFADVAVFGAGITVILERVLVRGGRTGVEFGLIAITTAHAWFLIQGWVDAVDREIQRQDMRAVEAAAATDFKPYTDEPQAGTNDPHSGDSQETHERSHSEESQQPADDILSEEPHEQAKPLPDVPQDQTEVEHSA